MKNVLSLKNIVISIILLAFIMLTYYRFSFLYPFAATWDQVDFVLALKDFDLLKMQPHFPGYPYFILGSVVFADFFEFGPESLSFFNNLMIVSSSIPIYFMAREWLTSIQSLVLVLTLYSISYVAVMVSQPISEGAALAVVFWFLWSILLASKKDSLLLDILPFLLFSVLLGIRLSYITFGIGLVLHFYHIWKKNESYRTIQILIFLFLAVMFQFIWVGALAANVGGFSTLWSVSIGFSEGHFTEWGGTAEEGNLVERFIKLVFFNIVWVGLLSENMILLILFVLIIGVVIIYRQHGRIKTSVSFYYLIVITSGIYFFWALIAQNIDKPRHSLPLILLVFFLFLIKLLKTKKIAMNILLAFWIGIQVTIGIQLVEKQATELPAVYQLEEYLRDRKEKFVLYTWEETRVFEYLRSPFLHKRVFTYDKFKSELKSHKDKKIYLTGQVIQGFELQGVDLRHKVKKRMDFTSDTLFDPVYAQIELYEWVNE